MATPQKSNSSSKRRTKWRPTANTEARRLANDEDDWKLATGAGASGTLSRTRGGSHGSSNKKKSSPAIPTPRRNLFVEADNEQSSVASSITASTMTSSSKKKYSKPAATRVILEVNPVTTLLEKYLATACPSCGSALRISFPTTCIASGCRLVCVNEEACTYVDLCAPCGSKVPLAEDAGSEKIRRNTDFGLNALYVIAFVASGDGGTEAARLLGMLGLPNSTTMQSRSFGNIERMLSPAIQGYTEEILQTNLEQEVALILSDRTDEKGDSLFTMWMENKLIEPLWPRMDGCADMGWQQKGAGRKRDSKSGHAVTIAMLTRKAVEVETCSNGCGYCKTWRTRHTVDEPPLPHRCFINHDGSSGSMEPLAVLRMYKKLYNKRVIVARFVLDDDASTKSKLKWSNETYMAKNNTTRVPKIINKNGNLAPRPNNGEIPAHMPEPLFVADPNHRRKTLANGLWNLASKGKTSPEEQEIAYEKKKKKKEDVAKEKGEPVPTIAPFKVKPWCITMTSMDCRRISKNFAFMARTLKDMKSDQEMINAGRAVLEHHFDCHEYCGAWCRRKKQLAEAAAQQQQEDDEEDNVKNLREEAKDVNKKFYRQKEDKVDAELYTKLYSIVARFLTLDALKELAHNMDTCANESFNNTVSWVAPKNRVYCGTDSLKNRISIALGISSIGTMQYYEGLFQRMGIKMNDDVRHYLRMKSTHRDNRITNAKTVVFKRKRKRGEMRKIKQVAKEAAVARAKRYGVYESGIAMKGGEDGVVEEEPGATAAPAPAPVATRMTTGKRVKACRCGATDHKRTSSKKCPLNADASGQRRTGAAARDTTLMGAAVAKDDVEDMADEIDVMDSLALEGDAESDALNSEDFFSANSDFSDGS